MVAAYTEMAVVRELAEPNVATIMKDNRQQFQQAKAKQCDGVPAFNSPYRAP